ncbi:MAG: acetoacetate decarboxylase family protein [Candidatus Binatia bacterium]
MSKRKKSSSVGARASEGSASAAASAEDNGVVIQGRRIQYPVVVRDAASASATFIVDAAAARAMLPCPDLDVIEILPGRTLFSLACIDYVDNDLGNYNEVSLAFFVREQRASRGIPYIKAAADFLRGRVSTFIFWLPVDQEFTREAGETMWGFPKTLEKIDFEHSGERATCTLASAGRHVLTFSMPRGGTRELKENAMTTYTLMDDRTCATRFVSRATGVGFYRSGCELTLGDHPTANWLRGLGLPKAPLAAVWMEHMHATFDPARPL